MKTLYLDTFSGISGDMFLGALLDLGLDFATLQQQLASLPISGYHLHASRKSKSSIQGVKFDVHLAHSHDVHDVHDVHHVHEVHQHAHSHSHSHSHAHAHEHDHRNFAQIKQLIGESQLSSWVKEKATAVFHRIAVAEGKIHGHPPEDVHFHEVGAIDSIVDIVGSCVGLELLGKPKILASQVVEGTGWVQCAHGRFPVPSTATLEILGARDIPVTQCEEPHELVTPTGAALLAEFVEEFGPMRQLVATKVGYGLGTRDLQSRPNVLRAILGTVVDVPRPSARDWETDQVTVLDANLDDCHPEILGHLVERALSAGALDLFYTPVQMKKNRPGVLLTVICAPVHAETLAELILTETSSFGLRMHTAERRKLRREFTTVRTAFGDVVVKIGRLNGKIIHASPEFESCRKLSTETQVPLKDIYNAAAGIPSPRPDSP